MYLEIKEFNIVIDVLKILYFEKDENILSITLDSHDVDNDYMYIEFDDIETCEYYYLKLKKILKAV